MNRARATWLDSVMTSPGVTSVMGAIALCASVIAADTDIPSAAMWTGVTAALLLLNKAFYFTQNPSPVIAGLFLMLQAAMPAYSSGENMDGALLALAAIAGLAALCSCFSAPQKDPHTVYSVPYSRCGRSVQFCIPPSGRRIPCRHHTGPVILPARPACCLSRHGHRPCYTLWLRHSAMAPALHARPDASGHHSSPHRHEPAGVNARLCGIWRSVHACGLRLSGQSTRLQRPCLLAHPVRHGACGDRLQQCK